MQPFPAGKKESWCRRKKASQKAATARGLKALLLHGRLQGAALFWSHVRFTSSMQSCKALCNDVMAAYGNSGWERCTREEVVSYSARTRIFSFRRKMEHFRNKSGRSAHQGHSGKTFRQEQKLQTPSSTFLCHLFFFLFLIIGSSPNPPEEIKQGTMVLIFFFKNSANASISGLSVFIKDPRQETD